MEKLYQYAWQHKFWDYTGTRLVDGRAFELISPGIPNHDSGPDFFNAKVKIEGQYWAGNVEIHTRSSDWIRHRHDHDAAYDSVILHAVGADDARIHRRDGSEIPQLVMKLPEAIRLTYDELTESQQAVRCSSSLAEIEPLVVTDWLESLAIERLQSKAERILNIRESCGGDWEQTCFITLARALGFGLNSEPFEQLGRICDIHILGRHSDNPVQLEAILFGQAGLLDSSCHIFDEYYHKLCAEYSFLLRKYRLRPMMAVGWRMARTRPQNFPHRRIAMLARMAEGGFSLLRKIIESQGKEERLRELFDREPAYYWRRHYLFGDEEHKPIGKLSASSVTLLLINTAAPLIYAYASSTGDCDLAEKAISLLESLPAEQNSIIRGWATLGLRADNALRSQALLHLRRQYCDNRKCMYCRMGHGLMRSRVCREEPELC